MEAISTLSFFRTMFLGFSFFIGGLHNHANAQTYCPYEPNTLYNKDYGCSEFNSAINDFSMANLHQTGTGCSGKLADYTSSIINLAQGESYFFNSASNSPSYYFPYEFIGIWIDFNDNGSFEDAGELSFSSPSGGIFSGVMSVPATAPLGNHRMRVRLKYDFNSPFLLTNSCTFYYNGEAHDYTVNISAAPSCTGLASLSVTDIAVSSAKVSWSCNGCSGSFIVEYGPVGFTPGTGNTAGAGGTIINATASPVTVTGLVSLTNYDIYVRRNCVANDYSLNFGPISFTTAYDYCATLSTITCGIPVTANIPTGKGGVDGSCLPADGKELLYSFTPAATGTYTLKLEGTGSVSYRFKETTSGCNESGWSCTDDYLVPASTYILGTLQAGHSYYLMLDARYASYGANHIFEIDCYTPYNPCDNIVSIDCGTPQTTVMPRGLGAFSGVTGNPVYLGKEKIYKFRPQATGIYTMTTFPSTEFVTVGYSFKKESEGCNSSGWHYITSNSYRTENQVDLIGTLIGGVDYYFLVDCFSLNGATRSFQIDCYQPYNPCTNTNIEPITCGTPVTFSVSSGAGTFLPSSCASGQVNHILAGKEKIYQFTPATSGNAALRILSNRGNNHLYTLIKYFIKQASLGCNNDNWQCIDFAGGGTSQLLPFPLTEGTSYYLLVDAGYYLPDNISGSDLSGNSQTFEITCPETWNPCTGITSLSCGAETVATIPAGVGKFGLQPGGFTDYIPHGKEVIYSFTPSVSGTHSLNITETDYKPPLYEFKLAFYYIKDATSGCDGTGWTFMGRTATPNSSIYSPYPLIASHTYYIMLDALYDGALQKFKITCPASTEPCGAITTISCNTNYSFAKDQGLGLFDPAIGLNSSHYPGKETIFEFTPPFTGNYWIELLSVTDYDLFAYFIKEASNGCNNNNWHFVSNFSYTGQSAGFPVVLNAGTSYYILADSYYGYAAGQTFRITCPASAYDPCSNITSIHACNSSMNTVHAAGPGAFSPLTDDNNSNFTAGKENLFSFTPSSGGAYGLKVENGGTGTIGYFIKKASDGCNNSGWQKIGFSYGGGFFGKLPFTLIAGVSYYILADPQGINGASQSFKITCPPADPCNSITSIICSGNTLIEVTLPAEINPYHLVPCFNTDNSIDGASKMFSFIPAATGMYNIESLNSFVGNLYFFVKDAATGCNADNWSCMKWDFYRDYTSPFPFIQGHTYYILVVLSSPSSEGNVSFSLYCTNGIAQYADTDGDGYGNLSAVRYDDLQPLFGYVFDNSDCNDANTNANPGAVEICNGIDDDCDGQVDEAGSTIFYRDADGDGYGNAGVSAQACTAPAGYVSNATDCNDNNASVNPAAVEVCRNNIDDNCNGQADEQACYVCKNATSFSTTNITTNSATLNWTSVPNPVQWQVQYKTTSPGSKWKDVILAGNRRSVTISGLLANQNYNWHIRAQCGKNWTDYSKSVSFKTSKSQGVITQSRGAGNLPDKSLAPETTGLQLKALPNPSYHNFNITVSGNNRDEKIALKVIDMYGRLIEQRQNLNHGQTIQIGNKYTAGMYLVEIKQGSQKRYAKLVKQ